MKATDGSSTLSSQLHSNLAAAHDTSTEFNNSTQMGHGSAAYSSQRDHILSNPRLEAMKQVIKKHLRKEGESVAEAEKQRCCIFLENEDSLFKEVSIF